jgi:hypothetical protein
VSRITRRPLRQLLAASLLLMATPAAACTGDCDGDGAVAVNETVRGVAILLGQSPLAVCPSFDRDGSLSVTVNELVEAVQAALNGCPGTPGTSMTASPTRTATPTGADTAAPPHTPTPTPTATVNQPPRLAGGTIYRTFAGAEVRMPLGTDPEGGPVECAAEPLPAGAVLQGAELLWTPAEDQLGPHVVALACSDAAQASAEGELAFKVLPLDPCSRPTCDPATGCTVGLPPPDELCCTEEAFPRVAEPDVGCPAGRAVFVGRNVTGFGRLQHCDIMHVRIFAQSGAQFTFKVESRCLDTTNRIEVFARVETRRRVLVNSIAQVFFEPAPNGFDRPELPLTFTVLGGGPFFDIEEDGEANMLVRLTDARNVSVETRLRVRLRERRPPDLPEID